MQNNELKAGTEAEQRTAADSVPSASLVQNGMLGEGMGRLNVLLGFEESQASTIEFRKLGHKAFSCDLKKCSGGKPEWHLKMDIFEALYLKKWDLIILHPPCTYTALCGNRWYGNSPLRKEGIELCKKKLGTRLCCLRKSCVRTAKNNYAAIHRKAKPNNTSVAVWAW